MDGTSKPSAKESSSKTSVTFKMDLNEMEKDDTGKFTKNPVFFADSFMDDPQNNVYLKLS